MVANIKETRDKVERYLADLPIKSVVNDKGAVNFRFGSTLVEVSVHEFGKGRGSTIVRIRAYMNDKVPPSPELYRHILVERGSFPFGHLDVQEKKDGCFISFCHGLFGNSLDFEEFNHAIKAVAITADQIDTEIHKKFGGVLFFKD